ncbi:hypothetical protein [Micromonospora sp. IBHARD004]|uniref:hypothetical protein n=1 Tax=Micromonospora sp. IBHARD004 TaxID=3457764 RepID=UPI004058C631
MSALHTGNAFWLIVPAIALAMSMAALVDPRPLTYIQAGAAVLIVVAVGAASSPVATWWTRPSAVWSGCSAARCCSARTR